MRILTLTVLLLTLYGCNVDQFRYTSNNLIAKSCWFGSIKTLHDFLESGLISNSDVNFDEFKTRMKNTCIEMARDVSDM